MRTDRIVDNATPYAARCAPADDVSGRAVVTVVTKAVWEIDDDGHARIALDPPTPRSMSEQRSDAPSSSIRYPHDVALYKPGTEVLLVGSARPPEDSVATQMDVTLRVAAGDRMLIDKTLTVYGPRVWQKGVMRVSPGPAAKLETTELCWENTYGGLDRRGAEAVVEDRNPVGRGIAIDSTTLIDTAVPPIEDPNAPLASRRPAPAGFGPVSADWSPRRQRFGTQDEQWRRTRAPLMPLDVDLRFACVAPDDQWLEQPLVGGEAIEVVGVRPGRSWRFRLPACPPMLTSRIDGVEQVHDTHLDTVLIDADEQRVELCWRLSLVMPRKSEKLEWVRVSLAEPLPDDIERDLADRHLARRAS